MHDLRGDGEGAQDLEEALERRLRPAARISLRSAFSLNATPALSLRLIARAV